MTSRPSEAAADRRRQLAAALGRVAGGDKSSLKIVYEMTSAKLMGICLRICRDREIAEDVLQDVYLKVWRRAGRYDAGKASPITWLAAVARNAAIDSQRRKSIPVSDDEQAAMQVEDRAPLADARVVAAEERERVHDCLDELDDPQRGCIREAFFDGSTYPELAKSRDVPLGTMKSWIRRGLAKLKDCLGG